EEHRLRTNINSGLGLYRIRVQFALATIDTALDELKAKARPHGEIITYLPTGSSADVDTIELEILMASREALRELQSSLAGPNLSVEEVRRRTAGLSEGATPLPPQVDPVSLGPRTSMGSARASIRPPPSLTPPAGQRYPGSMVPPPGGAGQDMSLRSVSQTVRVDIRKLDRLMTV